MRIPPIGPDERVPDVSGCRMVVPSRSRSALALATDHSESDGSRKQKQGNSSKCRHGRGRGPDYKNCVDIRSASVDCHTRSEGVRRFRDNRASTSFRIDAVANSVLENSGWNARARGSWGHDDGHQLPKP